MKDLKLAKEEKILKEYLYSTRAQKGLGGGKKTIDKKLIITNKRVISESKSEYTIIRKEMPLFACDYITSSYAKQTTSLAGAIVCMVIGLIAIIVSFVLKEQMYKLIPLALGIVLIAIGIILLVLALLKKSASVEIRIAGKEAEHSLLSVGSSNMTRTKGAKKIKIIVDRETSETMINEIGALLLDIKSGNFELEPETAESKAEEETEEKEEKDSLEETKEEVVSDEVTAEHDDYPTEE